MSKLDLLSKQDAVEAKALGWSVERIYDLDRSKWVIEIYPASALPGVLGLAHNNNPLAIRALQLVMAGHQEKRP